MRAKGEGKWFGILRIIPDAVKKKKWILGVGATSSWAKKWSLDNSICINGYYFKTARPKAGNEAENELNMGTVPVIR